HHEQDKDSNQIEMNAFVSIHGTRMQDFSRPGFTLIIDTISTPERLIQALSNLSRDTSELEMHQILNKIPQENLFGAVIVVIDNHGLKVARTIDGTRTLYHGNLGQSTAFATEKKCLWNVGIENVFPLDPGTVLSITWTGGRDVKEYAPRRQSLMKSRLSETDALKRLEADLRQSMSRVEGYSRCGVLFSGGVDSSLLAKISSDYFDEILLFTSWAAKSRDSEAARVAAQKLGQQIIEVPMSSDAIWIVLPKIVYAIESMNRMDVEIAIPFFLAAEKAKEHGIELMLSGQGPDELFAGYAKHLQVVKESGYEKLNEQLWNEISLTHEKNIARDARAIAFHGLESYFPYLDVSFANLALSLPGDWKVNLNETPDRKIIFRKLAVNMGLPSILANASKKATQYSSGSSKILVKAVGENVEECKGASRKETEAMVQRVLNLIALEMKMPGSPHEDTKLNADLEPTEHFVSSIPRLPASYER
ncbi:MAG: asparagine synthase C-terminal domain-containing protein, partial [Candidatus Thorarchaeota archaeon]